MCARKKTSAAHPSFIDPRDPMLVALASNLVAKLDANRKTDAPGDP